MPNVLEPAVFYETFGLARTTSQRLASRDGGEQLRLVPGERRRLVVLRVGADDPNDIERIARAVVGLGFRPQREAGQLLVHDPGLGADVIVEVADRVVGSELSYRLFVDGLGFKVSDHVMGRASFGARRTITTCCCRPARSSAFTTPRGRSTTSTRTDAVRALLNEDSTRHVWGVGRRYIGSNYFWYLRDPAGNFAEYYSDLDVIVDDDVWEPGTFADIRALFAWGPDVPRESLLPEDVAELIAGE